VTATSEQAARPPLLADTLSVILPTARQTRILRACLYSGEAGRRAWQAWRADMGDSVRGEDADERVLRRLRPMLYGALRRNEPTATKALAASLRTAYVREELRMEAYRRICARVLSTLAEAGIPTILLRGAALGGAAYGDWALRHIHDIDLLVWEDDLARSARALAGVGFEPLPELSNARTGDVTLRHRSGLPVALHGRLFRPAYANADLSGMWARSVSESLDGVAARVLSPADSLLHVCGHAAFRPSRGLLLWVCDAWQIIRAHPELDWAILLEGAADRHLSLPLYVTLRYLATGLNAAIPEAVLDRLAAAADADALGREGALHGALTAPNGGVQDLLPRIGGWRARALLLRWLLLPSPWYMRSAYNPRHPRLMPLYYLARLLQYGHRLLRYGARRIATRVRRRPVQMGAGGGPTLALDRARPRH
jgi:Uncharacterised nucleotidyltransferase